MTRGRQAVLAVVAIVVIVVAILELPHLHADTSTHSWQTPLPAVVLGCMIGVSYGLLAVGLVLIYRTNKIVNFAHGQVGAFAAAVFGIEVLRWHIPYWVGFPVALLVAGAVGGIAEVAVVRRLRRAPLLMSIVATLGVGQFLILFATALNSQASVGQLFPQPPLFPTANLGSLFINRSYFAMVILGPIAIIALGLFLQRTRYGLGILSSAANPEAARLSGVFARRMSTLAWVLAGALSGLTAILAQPNQGYSDPQSFGPSLLLIALAGAAVARMSNLTVAMLSGIGIGIIQQLVLWNYPQGGFFEAILFIIIVVALALQPAIRGREQERGSWVTVEPLKPIAEHLRRVWTVRNLGLGTAIIGVAFAATLPLYISNAASVTLTMIFAFAVVGLSVVMISGLGGQLTLGQFGIAAVAAVISFVVSRSTGDFLLAFAYAGVVGAGLSVALGLPSIRSRGLLLTVVTLAFALVVEDWLLNQSWALGEGVSPRTPSIAGDVLRTGHQYYYVALVVLVLAMAFVHVLARGGFGRLLIAVRDNEDNARAFTISASKVKLQGFAVAGFVAGVGGAMYGHSLSFVNASTFPTTDSIDVVTMSVIGGISLVAGPLLGAFVVIGIPAFVPLDSAGLAAAALGQLLIILYLPRGLASVIEPVRDRVVAMLTRHTPQPAASPSQPVPRRPLPKSTAGVLLSARHLSKSYGGIVAVDDVSLTLHGGEVLGLIGPNGAGKTTTFELLSGFLRPDAGTVQFQGVDITQLSPEARANLGLVRSFQEASLFPTMTVTDVVQLSLERRRPTRIISSRGNQWRRHRADELIGSMQLDRYREKQVNELSTGTRRIVELTCLIGLEPTLLLLDEPSSGIAQADVEMLGSLLRGLETTMVLIEHDIPLVMGLADRVIVMDAGNIIAAGSPAAVREDPAVIHAYFGSNETVINRSGARWAPATGSEV
jgi:ABC-type branched-subunit amino acid transport system ATPase component/ABC-type branched-subunit amino acid transport system permease subunit